MPRILKISLKVLAILIGLIVLLWLGLIWYVHANKQKILADITESLNENLQGNLQVADMDPTLLRGFPNVSVALKNVTLRDTQWASHHHDLINAKNIYVSIDGLSFLGENPTIKQVTIADGAIYMFTDSTGYTNAYMLQGKKKPDTTQVKKSTTFNTLKLENMQAVIENNVKNKLFQLDIKKLTAKNKETPGVMKLEISTETFIRSFAFNTTKGSYLKNKKLEADLTIEYDKLQKTLHIPNQEIEIDGEELNIGGDFFFAKKPAEFKLQIESDEMKFGFARSLLSPNISTKLDSIEFDEPLKLRAFIGGSMQYKSVPDVKIHWEVADNELKTPAGILKSVSFEGFFTNQLDPNDIHRDENSAIYLYGLDAKWQNIPFSADTVQVANLKKPVLYAIIHSKFPLKALNDALDINTMTFNSGTATMDIRCKLGIAKNDTTHPFVFGNIQISNADVLYEPKQLLFRNTNALVQFRGADLYVRNTQVQTKSSVLKLEGYAKNFLAFFFSSPERIVLDWNLTSAFVNLDEFAGLAAKSKTTTTTVKKKSQYRNINKISRQLDEAIKGASVRLKMRVNKMQYKTFTAQDVNADIMLDENSNVTVQSAGLKHAGGTLKINGKLNQLPKGIHMVVNAELDKVNIRELFVAFDNFGLETIKAENITGIFTSKISLVGNLTEDMKLVKNSIKGTVNFDLQNGTLVNFAPLVKISKFVFRKRNLDSISINKLANTLDIEGEKVTIRPMRVESSVLNIDLQGIYSIGKGTDIRLIIPLRNPKREELNLEGDVALEDNTAGPDINDLANAAPVDSAKVYLEAGDITKRKYKGLVLYLWAHDDEDGSVKISWDPKYKTGK